MDNNISFSKIVATPSLNSWSQAYNAGKLFAVLSLEKTQDSKNIESLNMLGRNLLERLEQEFFGIEDKNLESIKKAISAIFEDITEGINVSFAAGAFVENILYLFALGNAKISIKRGDNLGEVLSSENTTVKNIASASGFVNNKDLIVLTSEAFSQVIAQDDLNMSLNDSAPAEIAELLAPKIHKADDGRICAIIIKYEAAAVEQTALEKELAQEEKEAANELGEIRESEEKMEKAASHFDKYFALFKSKLKKPNLQLNSTRKLFLIIAIVVVLILISSVFLAVQKQNEAKVKALFAQIYPEAQKKYDEGQSLSDLSRSLARDSFLSAQKILNDNKDKFPTKSKEAIQAQELLVKIESGLTQVSPMDESGLDRSTLSVSVENGSGVEGAAGKAAAVLKDLGYDVASTGNADNYNYQGVTIEVKKENKDFLDLLKKDLSKDYAITSSSSDLSPDSPTNALIIIGK